MSDRRKEIADKTLARLRRFTEEMENGKHDWIVDAERLREVFEIAEEAYRLASSIKDMKVAEGYRNVATGFLTIVQARRDWSTWRTYWTEQAVKDLEEIIKNHDAE